MTLLRAPWRLLRLPYTLLEELRLKEAGSEIPEARLAFIEEMSGRTKAMLGFLMGNERLLAAGQVERARAAERLRAMTEEASAEAIEEEADDEFSERAARAERQKRQAAAEHVGNTQRVVSEATQERQRAESDAARGRNAVRRRAAGERKIIDTEEEIVREETAGALVVAAVEEAAAEEAKERADELEAVRRGNR